MPKSALQPFTGITLRSTSSNTQRYPTACKPARYTLTPRCFLTPATANALMAIPTLTSLVLCGLVMRAPRARSTYQIMTSSLTLVPLTLCYAVLLAHSWSPDTLSLILPGSLKEGFSGGFKPQFLPKVSGIASLFSQRITAASLWVHVVCINVFMARSIYLEALQRNVPMRLSVLASFICGPLGLLSHQARIASGTKN